MRLNAVNNSDYLKMVYDAFDFWDDGSLSCKNLLEIYQIAHAENQQELTNKDILIFKNNFAICVGSRPSTNASDFKNIKSMALNQFISFCTEYALFTKEKVLLLLKIQSSEVEAEFFKKKKHIKET